MAKRKQIEVGGGGPVVAAQGTTIPKWQGASGEIEQLENRLSVSEEAEANGEEIIIRVRDAIGAGPQSTKAVRDLAYLVKNFPPVVGRVPEYSDYMTWLVETRRDNVVARILQDTGPGRPRESYGYLIGIMDLIIEREGCSARRAAEIAEERYGPRLGKCARSIENDYSRYRRLYRLGRGGYFVRDEQLTARIWNRKDDGNE